jgi:radical SAM protein with 4Fe4S-binding SPASM domain
LAQKDPLEILGSVLGEKFLAYRQKWDLARTFKINLPYPLHVDYELANVCNLRCPMCLYATKKPQTQKLSLNTVRDIIENGARLGQCSMGFGGVWEPLMSPYLGDLIEHGRSQGLVDIMFNTNGQLLTREKSRTLIEAGLTRLMVSVDAATAQTYALMRPGGDFKLLENNILEFLAQRKAMAKTLPLLRLSFCLTAYNQKETELFWEKWASKVEFFSLQTYGRFSQKLPALFAPQKQTLPGGRCAQPHKRLLVRHNGQVLPCCDLSGLDLEVGDIKQQSLEEIWAGEKINNLRHLLGKNRDRWPDICQKCQDKYKS